MTAKWDTRWERKTQRRTLKSGFVYEGAVGGVGFAEWMGEGIKDAVDNAIPDAALSAAHRVAAQAEEQMKLHAPWRDRTGNARKGLYGAAQRDGNIISVEIGHGPDIHYGIWLENRWNGRYAIVLPTAEVLFPRLGDLLQGEIILEMAGRGSKYRHPGTGRFA